MQPESYNTQNNLLVSICMVTYNHEKWIGQAIESILMQRTSFRIELIIGEDCSQDKTADIIKTYKDRYPEIIKVTFNKVNIGLGKNFSQSMNRCNGKYIAICEGDDFWTDEKKLTKQVEFLEANRDYVMCSHNITRLYNENNTTNSSTRHNSSFTYDQRRFLSEWVTQPLSCILRNIFSDYTYFEKEDIFCDVIIFYEFLKHGSGYFMADNMATFRIHQNALSSGLTNWQWNRNHIVMYDHLFKYNSRDLLLQQKSAHYCLVMYVEALKKREEKRPEFNPLAEYYKRTPRISKRIFTRFIRVPYYFIKYRLL